MTSAALDAWVGGRAESLDRLIAAHSAVGGGGPGRKWDTDELNHAILLRLAAEFQGFCRDLHGECVEALLRAAVTQGGVVGQVIRAEFSLNRKLDSGNATPGGVGSDFARLGMTLWPDIYNRYPSRGPMWNRRLELLNTVRNAIAHDDAAKTFDVRAAGWPLTLPTARRWRRSLDGLARGMDTVCKGHMTRLIGKPPW